MDLFKKKKMIKNINSKLAANSQLSAEPKTNKLTKQTTGTGTESQKWRTLEGLSAGRWRGRVGDKVEGISINGRYKIGGG